MLAILKSFFPSMNDLCCRPWRPFLTFSVQRTEAPLAGQNLALYWLTSGRKLKNSGMFGSKAETGLLITLISLMKLVNIHFFISSFISSCLSNSVLWHAYPSIDSSAEWDLQPQALFSFPWLSYELHKMCRSTWGRVFKSLLLIVLDAQTAHLLTQMKCPTPLHHHGPTPQWNLSKTKPWWICWLSQLATLKPFYQTADAFNRVPFREWSPWTLLSAGSLKSLEGRSSAAKKNSVTSDTKKGTRLLRNNPGWANYNKIDIILLL